MTYDPTGGLAVVTGGGSGIGAALCVRLTEAGARCIVADIDEPSAVAVAATLPGAMPMRLDVADAGSVEQAVGVMEDAHGPIGLWCSNAGIQRGRGLGDAASWGASLDVNLMGHVNAARHVLPRMVARRSGHMVVTASAAGLLTDFRSAPYAVSKHAAVALAEWLAISHGDDGVSISCVCPEGVRTAMTRSDSATVGADFLEADQVAADILAGLAAGRFLILPHPKVAEYETRRTGDRERWLNGMRRARQRLQQHA